MDQDFLTVEQVAKNLLVSEETVRDWIKKKQLAAYKVGRDYRINRVDYDKFLRERRTKKDE